MSSFLQNHQYTGKRRDERGEKRLTTLISKEMPKQGRGQCMKKRDGGVHFTKERKRTSPPQKNASKTEKRAKSKIQISGRSTQKRGV